MASLPGSVKETGDGQKAVSRVKLPSEREVPCTEIEKREFDASYCQCWQPAAVVESHDVGGECDFEGSDAWRDQGSAEKKTTTSERNHLAMVPEGVPLGRFGLSSPKHQAYRRGFLFPASEPYVSSSTWLTFGNGTGDETGDWTGHWTGRRTGRRAGRGQ